jgi:hypothetical protein
LRQTVGYARTYLIAAAYIVLVFLVRLLVLTLSLPLFLVAALTGLIDGLVRRDVRRFGAGRESGFVCHRAKAALLPLVTLPWVIYLALPVSVHPLWILLPGAARFGAASCIAPATFNLNSSVCRSATLLDIGPLKTLLHSMNCPCRASMPDLRSCWPPGKIGFTHRGKP